MSIRFSRSCSALAAFSLLLIPLKAGAQNTPVRPPVPPATEVQTHSSPAPVDASRADAVSPDHEYGSRKLPLEQEKPYSSWKHHVAEKPEEAVVQVRYWEAGSESKLTTTGLMIRCDGFVLVPKGVRDVARRGGSVEVVLRHVDRGEPGEHGDKKKTAAPVTATARNHPDSHSTVPYALIKTTGHHARSLPLLESGNVAVGTRVRVLWIGPEAGRTADAVRSRNGTIGPAAENGDRFSVSPAEDTDEPVTAIPSGAVVVDAESGGALGIVTQAGTHPAFVTLTRFHVISGEVGLAHDRAAVRLGDRPGTLPQGTPEMVWVPGGPVSLDGTVARDFTRDYDTTVACTAGFWMAVHPVTNGEYRQWLERQMVRRLPRGWTVAEMQKPAVRRADRPAVGMLPADAAFFASSRRSRLPTEVEWRRGAYVRDTSWVEQRNDDWNRTAGRLSELYVRHQGYVRNLIQVAKMAEWRARTNARSGYRNNARTNLLIPSTPELEEATAELLGAVNLLSTDEWMWGTVGPIDAFRQDISIFGVRNVLINAPELVQGTLLKTPWAPKFYSALVDPDLTVFKWSSSASATKEQRGADELLREMTYKYYVITLWGGGSASMVSIMGNPVIHNSGDDSYSGALSISVMASYGTSIKPGFRCAR